MPTTTAYTDAQLTDLLTLEQGLYTAADLSSLVDAATRLAETGIPAGKGARRILRQIQSLWRDLCDELEPDLIAAAGQRPEDEAPF